MELEIKGHFTPTGVQQEILKKYGVSYRHEKVPPVVQENKTTYGYNRTVFSWEGNAKHPIPSDVLAYDDDPHGDPLPKKLADWTSKKKGGANLFTKGIRGEKD